MENSAKWKKYKRSGAYQREIKKYTTSGTIAEKLNILEASVCGQKELSGADGCADEELQQNQYENISGIDFSEVIDANDEISNRLNDEQLFREYFDAPKKYDLKENLRRWALVFNIPHTAITALLVILNLTSLSPELPRDSRTLLRTDSKAVLIKDIKSKYGEGRYWHHGIGKCLGNYFCNVKESKKIELKVFIDGLPLFRSSRGEFWPILGQINGFSKVMVFGIYSGIGKPADVAEFLTPFVEEMLQILKTGVTIAGHTISVSIRCFICDSPARSFVKGVVYFNNQNGCQKCMCIGEHNKNSKTQVFPRLNCAKRTDTNFRMRLDEDHHQTYSPLEKLPIDMVNQFPIADVLHLIDLGVTKRLLTGWHAGKFGYETKWSSEQSKRVSNFLKSCKLPKEIHRALRGLEEVSNWKGLEFRTFLLYVSPVALRLPEILPQEYYEHFLLYFCAVTLCSAEAYHNYLDLAQNFLHEFVEQFISLYGVQYITSNLHNLVHLVDDVRLFGTLMEFSSYPFESSLFQIKQLIRTGRDPLKQVAKRIDELDKFQKAPTKAEREENRNVIYEKRNNDTNLKIIFPQSDAFYHKVKLNSFALNALKYEDKWILTKANDIVEIINFMIIKNETIVYGYPLKTVYDLFEKPMKSSILNIYQSDCRRNVSTLYYLKDIKLKLVPVKFTQNVTAFIPLLHTYEFQL